MEGNKFINIATNIPLQVLGKTAFVSSDVQYCERYEIRHLDPDDFDDYFMSI
jgi:hypothetical protein